MPLIAKPDTSVRQASVSLFREYPFHDNEDDLFGIFNLISKAKNHVAPLHVCALCRHGELHLCSFGINNICCRRCQSGICHILLHTIVDILPKTNANLIPYMENSNGNAIFSSLLMMFSIGVLFSFH